MVQGGGDSVEMTLARIVILMAAAAAVWSLLAAAVRSICRAARREGKTLLMMGQGREGAPEPEEEKEIAETKRKE